MKRCVIVISALLCLLVVAASVSAAPQSALLRSCLRYDRPLVASVSDVQQRTLLALSMATAENPAADPAEVLSTYQQLAAGVVELLKSDTSAFWNVDRWTDESRTTYTYDVSNRLSVSVGEYYDVSWKNLLQMIMTYDASSHLLTLTNKQWQGGAWVNYTLTTYSAFTGEGFPTTALTQFWTGTAWKDSLKVTYTYVSGRMTSSVFQQWSGSAWINGGKNTYTYDGGGHLIQFLIQTWQGGAWVNVNRVTSVFNAGGDETQATTQMWQGGAWVDVQKEDYTYDGSHHRILTVRSMWLTVMWMAMYNDTMKYSGDKLIERVEVAILAGTASRTQWTYNANGNETLELSQDWDLAGEAWVNTDRTKSVYNTGGGSCCVGVRGNVNLTDIINISDLSLLVAYLTVVPPPALPCPDAANVNTTGIIDISDLSLLVGYLTLVPPPSLPSCP